VSRLERHAGRLGHAGDEENLCARPVCAEGAPTARCVATFSASCPTVVPSSATAATTPW
jgi:hypothetical protein